MLVIRNDKFGFTDNKGKLVIPCVWNYADSFKEGLASVRNENGLWGFIDKSGEIVVPCIWRDVDGFSEGLACVFNGIKYGYIDKNGKQVIPCKWDCACSFEDGLASVDGGFINKAGEWVFHNKEWKQVSSRFYSGTAFWEDYMGNIGTIDKTGRITVLPLREPNEEEEQDDELLNCSRIDDSTGKIILPKYHTILFHINSFDDGLCMVKDKNGKIGYYDMFGKIVIPCKWTNACAFSDGVAAVMNEEHLWGFIDVEGNIIIECQWISVVQSFINGVAIVMDDDDEFAVEYEINKKGE